MEPVGLGKKFYVFSPSSFKCIFYNVCLMLGSLQVTQATALAKLNQSPSRSEAPVARPVAWAEYVE